jgi:hypothetical protein
MEDRTLPSLYRNGVQNPDRWAPSSENQRDPVGCSHPEPGDLLAWRYAAWLVEDVRLYLDVDLTDEQRDRIDASVKHLSGDQRTLTWERHRPFHLILRHHNGPLIVKDGWEPLFKRIREGREISLTSWPDVRRWYRLPDPYQTCSCHGHIWPCQDVDRAAVAEHQLRKMDRLMATTDPGRCACCRELITLRQKTVTFPEESEFVPGFQGPTFHAGRAVCWGAAEKYERRFRLAKNPDISRLASCPGVQFIHEHHGMPTDQRLECSAGQLCTGLHGPAGYRRDAPCWHKVIIGNHGDQPVYPRPERDCGYYRPDIGRCLGGDLSQGGSSINPVAADLLWENQQRSRRAA